MCGRFVRKLYASDLAEEFAADEVMTDLAPGYNIAPTQDVAVIVGVTGESQILRRLVAMRWGLVPWWAEDPSIGGRMINARAESLTTKSAFKDSFNKRRCLVLASGFIAPRPLELSFSRPEIGTLFLTVLIGAIVAGDGRSNWYKGVQLILVYAMIAILFYFLPAANH